MKINFSVVLYLSASAIFTVPIVLCVRLLLKKAPARYSYLLWLVVFLRLIWPVWPEVEFGIVPETGIANAVADRMLIPEMSGRLYDDMMFSGAEGTITPDVASKPIADDSSRISNECPQPVRRSGGTEEIINSKCGNRYL